MLCLKKVYRDELLQLALILSLLRIDPDSFLGYDVPNIVGIHDLSDGPSWAHTYAETLINRRFYVHPKNLDSVLLNYQREVFEDLNALGRYNRINTQNVTAYLLNSVDGVNNNTSFDSNRNLTENNYADRGSIVPIQGPSSEPSSSGTSSTSASLSLDDFNIDSLLEDPPELSQEDMDLIEVLWKQDVDLGFSLDLFNSKPDTDEKSLDLQDEEEEENLQKLKALEALHNDTKLAAVKNEEDSEDDGSICPADSINPWDGLAYTVDLETGECVLKDSIDSLETSESSLVPDDEPSSLLNLSDFSLEEALQLVELDEDTSEVKKERDSSPVTPVASPEEKISDELKAEPDDVLEINQSDDELGILSDMIQTAQFHHPHPHPRSFQGRMPFVRAMSMEQRWQDLANLLSLPGPGEAAGIAHPFPHHHHHHHHHHHGYGAAAAAAPTYAPDSARGVLLHNATLAPPLGDINNTNHYPNVAISGSNLGSAVATSMNLTNSSEPMGENGATGAYKMEPPHEMMYYQNSTPEITQTTEGFLSSILNDEDLQLMDMAMNEGMYTMRMLESNNSNNASSVASMGTALQAPEERMDASSDSAVSSMGSERVPSLSDGEWMETSSDSGHTPGDHYPLDYHASKYRAYDYSYSSRQHSATALGTTDSSNRMPPMAQKKHQMFGKRYFQDQGSGSSSLGSHGAAASLPTAPIKYEYGEAATGAIAPSSAFEGAVAAKPAEMKYSCSMEFARHHSDPRSSLDQIHHNHTYHLPAESNGVMQRPVSRDKPKGRKSDEEHLNRDEKRARAMNIPLPVPDIINLPMDEFNERLSKYDLSEAQLSLIRDIRRRGKNKVAAQNCRKRKLDQILTLADEVKEMRERKNKLLRERDYILAERQRAKEKYSQLYRHVFQALRDPDGNPYSYQEFSLQQSADGTVFLVPRANASTLMEPDLSRTKHKDHKE